MTTMIRSRSAACPLALVAALLAAAPTASWAAEPGPLVTTAQAEPGGDANPTDPEDGEAPADGEAVASDDFDTLVQRASEAFAAKDYAAALDFFEQAYALDADPAILFNMGIIADKNGDIDKAVRYFNDFVMVPDIDVDAREEALRRLEQLRKLQALRAEQNTQGDQPPRDPTPPTTSPSAYPERSYTGPIIVTAAGGLLLAAGGVVAGLAASKHGDFEAATTLPARRDAADSGKLLATTADLLFVAGGLTAVAGAIWIVVVATGDSETDAVSLAPTVGPGAVGIDLTVRF